ncbi:MAG: high-affinity branched-chain amino acid ABC transporter permease LivM [Alphaproteobacteria bacterium]|nr:high-affinity branched-chain amino acid ABC transporter permease LivM [Alphaproteobacteria bacterium]
MFPMIGLYTSTRAGGLAIETRWIELAIGVLLIFLGRIALIRLRDGERLVPFVGGVFAVGLGLQLPLPNGLLTVCCIAGGAVVVLRSVVLWVGGKLKATNDARNSPPLAARAQLFLKQYGPWLGAAVIAFAIAFPWLPFADRRLIDLATLVLIYVMLGWGLNIVVGLAGLLDLGYVAFYAIGAYSFALLSSNYDMSFWACLPVAAMLAAFLGILLGFPVLRLRGDYLAIVTLGFGEMIRIILINWVDFTKGPDGISGIPKPTLFGLSFSRRPPEGTESFHQFFDIPYASVDRIIFLFYVALGLALLTNAFILRIRKLPIGRAWEALREDEIACRSLGLNPTNIKLSAFALGAMFGGLAGAVFAARQSFISPESFTFIESAIILAVVVLGGMGSQIGVAIAAILLIGLPEWFRELQDYRMLAFGALMVAIMVWRPKGILSFREPTLRLHEEDRGAKQ